MTWLILIALIIGALVGYFFCWWQVERDEDLVYVHNVKGLKCCTHEGVGYQLKRTPPSGILDPNIDNEEPPSLSGLSQGSIPGTRGGVTLEATIKRASPTCVPDHRLMAARFCRFIKSDTIRGHATTEQLYDMFMKAQPWALSLEDGTQALYQAFREHVRGLPGASIRVREYSVIKTEVYNALIAVCSEYLPKPSGKTT